VREHEPLRQPLHDDRGSRGAAVAADGLAMGKRRRQEPNASNAQRGGS
jgi:hypothetical protein